VINFELTDEHKMLQDTVRKFTLKEVEPVAGKLDRSAVFLEKEFMKIYKGMADLGFFRLLIPEEYGGTGGFDILACSIIFREIAKASAGMAGAYMPPMIVCGVILNKFCTEEQKKKYLPLHASGEMITCFGVTEPGAGSDVGAITTSFVREGNELILNGSKQFITNAPVADLFFILAKDENGKPCGVLVEKGTKGLSCGEPLSKMGHRATPTSEVFLDNCRVPASNLVGEEGKGAAQSLMAIELERIFCASENVGIAEAALAKSVDYAKQRYAFGKSISKFQAIQHLLAQMATGVEAGHALLYYAIWDVMKNKDVIKKFPSLPTSVVKYYTGTMVEEVTSNAIQIHGGYGYLKEYDVERYYRDSKLFQIGGGTSQIQEGLICKNLLA